MDFRRGDRTRTCDSLVPNQERYQLRYTPNGFSECCFQMKVGVTGLEPATAWSQTRNATNCATPRKTLVGNLRYFQMRCKGTHYFLTIQIFSGLFTETEEKFMLFHRNSIQICKIRHNQTCQN